MKRVSFLQMLLPRTQLIIPNPARITMTTTKKLTRFAREVETGQTDALWHPMMKMKKDQSLLVKALKAATLKILVMKQTTVY